MLTMAENLFTAEFPTVFGRTEWPRKRCDYSGCLRRGAKSMVALSTVSWQTSTGEAPEVIDRQDWMNSAII
jgi:hypothetical protein